MVLLAKPALDVGIYTEDWDAARAFYVDRLGLTYEELLKVGGGVHQHRLTLGGGVLKVNASRTPLATEPGPYAGLVVARPVATTATDLVDPVGVPVRLVRPGTDGVAQLAVRVRTRDPSAYRHFAVDGLGAEELAPDRLRVGTTVLLLERAAGDPVGGALRCRGLRYLTVQVHDCVAEHRRLVDGGYATEGAAPVRLGDVARISFVRDPDGGWVEISQRATLTSL